MAYYLSRLCNKSAVARLPALISRVSHSQKASTGALNLTYKAYEPPKLESHDVKNTLLGRPMSPHLTHIIFTPQLTSTLSITHRISGLMLSGYATAMGVAALILPYDVSQYIAMIEGLNLSPATIFLAKFILASPFGYHSANGIRHLYWDTGKGLTIKEVYMTGYAMLAATIAITVALASL